MPGSTPYGTLLRRNHDGSAVRQSRLGPKGYEESHVNRELAKPLAWNRRRGLSMYVVEYFCASLADVYEDRPELTPVAN